MPSFWKGFGQQFGETFSDTFKAAQAERKRREAIAEDREYRERKAEELRRSMQARKNEAIRASLSARTDEEKLATLGGLLPSGEAKRTVTQDSQLGAEYLEDARRAGIEGTLTDAIIANAEAREGILGKEFSAQSEFDNFKPLTEEERLLGESFNLSVAEGAMKDAQSRIKEDNLRREAAQEKAEIEAQKFSEMLREEALLAGASYESEEDFLNRMDESYNEQLNPGQYEAARRAFRLARERRDVGTLAQAAKTAGGAYTHLDGEFVPNTFEGFERNNSEALAKLSPEARLHVEQSFNAGKKAREGRAIERGMAMQERNREEARVKERGRAEDIESARADEIVERYLFLLGREGMSPKEAIRHLPGNPEWGEAFNDLAGGDEDKRALAGAAAARKFWGDKGYPIESRSGDISDYGVNDFNLAMRRIGRIRLEQGLGAEALRSQSMQRYRDNVRAFEGHKVLDGVINVKDKDGLKQFIAVPVMERFSYGEGADKKEIEVMQYRLQLHPNAELTGEDLKKLQKAISEANEENVENATIGNAIGGGTGNKTIGGGTGKKTKSGNPFSVTPLP